MARIGLLSDSHGRALTTRLAVLLLVEHGAELLIHLGDVGNVEVIDALAGVTDANGRLVPAHLVFGNTDHDAPSLTRYARSLDVAVDHPVGSIDLATLTSLLLESPEAPEAPESPDSGELVFTHGDNAAIMENALARQVRYLCHGHTHQAADRQMGATRVINPGALFRAQSYTVALLDTKNDALAFYPVGSGC